MDYLLYKEAKPKLDQAVVKSLAGAAGGGALGYLLTRYGLGIKGIGAGLTGAGIGATLGAAGGSYLGDYYDKQEGDEKEYKRQIQRLEEKVKEPITQTFRKKLFHPTTAGIGVGSGIVGAVTTPQAHIDEAAKREADKLWTDVQAAAKKGSKERSAFGSKTVDESVLTDAMNRKRKGAKKQRQADIYSDLLKNKKDLSFQREMKTRARRGGRYGLALWLLSSGLWTGASKSPVVVKAQKDLIKSEQEGNKK